MELNDSAIAFLSQVIRSYADFTDQELQEVIACFEARVYPKNEYLLKKGQVCDFWGFIQHGLIRSWSLKDDDDEYTIGCLFENSFISESMSFFKRVPTSVNIHALEETTLLFISFAKLQELFLKYNSFERFARRLYEDRLANIKSRMLYRVQLSATDRYLHLLTIQPELIERVPLKYIASYLNITDSTLSRIRRKISQKKA